MTLKLTFYGTNDSTLGAEKWLEQFEVEPQIKCPHCKGTNVHKHDDYCDDEHPDDEECFDFYCDSCGTQFDESD